MANHELVQSVIEVLDAPTPASHRAELAPVKFDRLSVERRVLGFITDEAHLDHGPRNTLLALTKSLTADRNTTHPPTGHPRLEVEGVPLTDVVEAILGHLERLESAGLIVARPNGSYALTDAGQTELTS